MDKAKIVFKNLILFTGRTQNSISAILPNAHGHNPTATFVPKSTGQACSKTLKCTEIKIPGLPHGNIDYGGCRQNSCPQDSSDLSFDWVYRIGDEWPNLNVASEVFNLYSKKAASYINLTNGKLRIHKFVCDTQKSKARNPVAARIYMTSNSKSRARAIAYSVAWETGLNDLGGKFVIEFEDRCSNCVEKFTVGKNANGVAEVTIDNEPQKGSPKGVGVHFKQFEKVLDGRLTGVHGGKVASCPYKRGVPVKKPKEEYTFFNDLRPENCWSAEC